MQTLLHERKMKNITVELTKWDLQKETLQETRWKGEWKNSE